MLPTFRKRTTFVVVVLSMGLLIRSYLDDSRAGELVLRRERAVLQYPSVPIIERAVSIFDDDLDLSKLPKADLMQLAGRNLVLFGHLDLKSRYKLFPNVFSASNFTDLVKEPICVALQSTLDYIVPGIHRYLENWPGLISYALFTPSSLFYIAVVLIKHLRKCHPRIKNQITWHLSHPKLLPPPEKFTNLLTLNFNCTMSDVQVLSLLQSTADSIKDADMPNDLLYPQNAMRNLARRHCKSEWVMCPDVDMIFPDAEPGKPDHFSKLGSFFRSGAARDCESCAFVLPLYEVVDLGLGRVPDSKRRLLQYVSKGLAQIYHAMTFKGNYHSANLSAWEQIAPVDAVGVAFPVQYSWWFEPVYIVRHGSPPFDERFIGYGMTRNSQALEMHLANYSYYLLDSVFLCHLWGLKSRNKGKASWHQDFRKRQVHHNSKEFHTHFTRELAVRYDRDLGELITDVDDRKLFRIPPKLGVRVVKPNNATNFIYRL